LYELLLTPFVSAPLWLSTAVILGACTLSAIHLKLSLTIAITLFIASYVAQDLAHWISGEPTFQSVYQERLGMLSLEFWSTLGLHTLFMLPLVVDSSVFKGDMTGKRWSNWNAEEVLSWFCVRDRVFTAKLDSDSDVADLKVLFSVLRPGYGWMDDFAGYQARCHYALLVLAITARN
jgi:hypothetical protein